jgi:hypothetical protein
MRPPRVVFGYLLAPQKSYRNRVRIVEVGHVHRAPAVIFVSGVAVGDGRHEAHRHGRDGQDMSGKHRCHEEHIYGAAHFLVVRWPGTGVK